MRFEHWIYVVPLRLRSLFRRADVESELDEELRYHIELQIEENIAKGMTADDARYAALRAMGGVEQRKEECRDMRRVRFIEDLWQDFRFGARMLAKRPVFTIVALVTLALGIGANTAIFSVVNSVLLRPLPYEDPDRIVKLWNTFPPKGITQLPFSAPEFLEFRRASQSFDHVGAYFTYTRNLTGAGEPEQIPATWASSDFFSVLGVQPILGRTFSAEEDLPGNNGVVVLSHRLWQSHFGADPDIVGKPITLQGWSYTVVGVMPQGFQFPSENVGLWMPLAIDPASTELGRHHLNLIARVRQETRLEQARAEAQSISGNIAQKYPEYYRQMDDPGIFAGGIPVTVTRLHEQTVGDVRLALLVLLGGVGFMLLVACTNVANLLLARATARTKEIATRTALGASRLRIIRQLLTESVLLFVLGGALGLLLAMWGVRILVASSPVDLPRVGEVTIDGWVLTFTALTSLLTGVFFGLVPALQASKTDLNETLKEGGRSGTDAPGRNRLRNLLVVAEIALSVVLLTGAGLMVRSFVRLQEVKPGFDPTNLLTLHLDLPSSKYPEGRQVTAFFRQLIERTNGLPGVSATAVVSQLPPSEERNNSSFEAEGQKLEGGSDIADYAVISPDYFRTMNIPILQGRPFVEADSERPPAAVIVNQTMARVVWPGEDAVGKRLRQTADSPWLSVVGVVADVKNRGLRRETKPEMFFPHTEKPFGPGGPPSSMALVVRTASDPQSVMNAIKAEIRDLDSALPIFKVETMEQIISSSISQMRFTTVLLSCFAGVALVLAAVGVYGVMSYSVARRTHEIGIRMALGAQPGDIRRLFVRQGFALALVGVAFGLIGAFALTDVLSNLLYEVSPTDPLTLTSISALLTATALLACYLPARRATRVDQLTALRYE